MANYKGGVLLQEIARLRRRDLDHPVLSSSLLFNYYLLYAVYLLYIVRLVLVTWLMMFAHPSTVSLYFTYDRLCHFLNLFTGHDEYFLLVTFFASISTAFIHYRLYCKRHPLLWEMFSPLLSSFPCPTASGPVSAGRFKRLTQKITSLLGRPTGNKSRKESVGSSLTEQDEQGGPLHFAKLDETHLRKVLRLSQLYQKAYLCYPYANTVIFACFFLFYVQFFAFDPSLSLLFKVTTCVDFLLGSTFMFIFVRILLFHYYLIIIVGYLLYQEFSCINGDFTQWANRWIQSTCTQRGDPCRAARSRPLQPPARAVFTFLRSEHTRVCLLASYLNQSNVSPFLSSFLFGIFFFNVHNLTNFFFFQKPLTFRIFIILILFIQTVPPTAIALVLVQLNGAIYGASDAIGRVLPRIGILNSSGRHSSATWREQNRICDYLQLLLCKRKRFAFSAGVFGTFTQDSVFKFYLIYAGYIMNFTSRFIIDKQENN